MSSLISIIIPVYNVEKYLERCVESIIKQTYKNLEIIMIDDGATDGSGKICDHYAKIDSRIKVLHKTNGGLSSARNAGIDVMTGEYVMFVDSDDYIASDCVEYLFYLIDKFSAQISIGNYEETSSSRYEFKNKQECFEQISGKEAIERQFGKNTIQYVSAWAKLYDSKLFQKIRFPEGMLHEDEGTTYRVLYSSNKVIVSEKIVYAYYCNLNSITKHPKKKNYEDLCLILIEQMVFYKKNHERILEARVRNRYCIQTAAHYLPKGYYGDSNIMLQKAREMHKGIWNIKEIPATERLKGWVSSQFCPLVAKIINNR